MTTTQKLLANLKRDIDTLNRMGEEITSVHNTRYELYANGTRPNYYSILKDRCSVLINIVSNLNSNEEFRKEEAYEYIVDSYSSLIEDYRTFVLTTDLSDDDGKLHTLKLLFNIYKYILDLGQDIIDALTGYADSMYITKVADLLVSI